MSLPCIKVRVYVAGTFIDSNCSNGSLILKLSKRTLAVACNATGDCERHCWVNTHCKLLFAITNDKINGTFKKLVITCPYTVVRNNRFLGEAVFYISRKKRACLLLTTGVESRTSILSTIDDKCFSLCWTNHLTFSCFHIVTVDEDKSIYIIPLKLLSYQLAHPQWAFFYFLQWFTYIKKKIRLLPIYLTKSMQNNYFRLFSFFCPPCLFHSKGHIPDLKTYIWV